MFFLFQSLRMLISLVLYFWVGFLGSFVYVLSSARRTPSCEFTHKWTRPLAERLKRQPKNVSFQWTIFSKSCWQCVCAILTFLLLFWYISHLHVQSWLIRLLKKSSELQIPVKIQWNLLLHTLDRKNCSPFFKMQWKQWCVVLFQHWYKGQE